MTTLIGSIIEETFEEKYRRENEAEVKALFEQYKKQRRLDDYLAEKKAA